MGEICGHLVLPGAECICSWKLRAPIQCEVTQDSKCLAVRLGRFGHWDFFPS